jgi:Zn-dependent M28 family amino/carboxypeptidase
MMKNLKSPILISCFLIISSCHTDRGLFHNEYAITIDEVSAHLRFLASDELKGRKAGTEEATIAARYIAEQFRSAGVKTFAVANDYFQQVPINTEKRRDDYTKNSIPKRCKNVIGFIEGSDPLLKDEYVLLVAHFDHLGIKVNESDSEGDSIYNGARDNGIGTVTLISAAKVLASHPPARPVILLASTGEEEGMIGSKYFFNNSPVDRRKIVFVLNSDGGGYNDTTLVRIGGLLKVNLSNKIVEGLRHGGLKCLPYPPELEYLSDERSDCLPFLQSGIPSITFSPGFDKIDDEITRYVHTIKDKAGDNFNYSYLLKLCRAYITVARIVADKN